LPEGTNAVVELGTGWESVEELRAGRPVVYLDQNQWSKLSAWRQEHRRLPSDEAAGAESLVRLVEREELLLPVSAAHIVETVPSFGKQRVGLASTVLAFSRGRQMRNPLHVRLDELVRALSGMSPGVAGRLRPKCRCVLLDAPSRRRASGLPAPL